MPVLSICKVRRAIPIRSFPAGIVNIWNSCYAFGARVPSRTLASLEVHESLQIFFKEDWRRVTSEVPAVAVQLTSYAPKQY
jgi:hypothetical protein